MPTYLSGKQKKWLKYTICNRGMSLYHYDGTIQVLTCMPRLKSQTHRLLYVISCRLPTLLLHCIQAGFRTEHITSTIPWWDNFFFEGKEKIKHTKPDKLVYAELCPVNHEFISQPLGVKANRYTWWGNIGHLDTINWEWCWISKNIYLWPKPNWYHSGQN